MPEEGEMVENHREGDEVMVGRGGTLHRVQQCRVGQDHGGEGGPGDGRGRGPGPGGEEQEPLRLQGGEEAADRRQVPIGGAGRGILYVLCVKDEFW